MHNKIQIEVLVESSKNCSRSRIVASPYYRMKILVAAASDRANTVFIIPLQPCSHIVYSFTRLPPPHYNVCHKLVTSLSQPCHKLVTTLSQPCHNIVIFSPPHCKLVITLQSCDKVTHVNLIIFILTKTQRKSIEVHFT